MIKTHGKNTNRLSVASDRVTGIDLMEYQFCQGVIKTSVVKCKKCNASILQAVKAVTLIYFCTQSAYCTSNETGRVCSLKPALTPSIYGTIQPKT